MTALPHQPTSPRAARVLAVVAVLGAAALFLLTLRGLTTPAADGVVLELPASTIAPPPREDETDIPPAPTGQAELAILPLNAPQMAAAANAIAADTNAAEQPQSGRLEVSVNDLLGLAENAQVFPNPAPAAEDEWKFPAGVASSDTSDEGDEPPLPNRQAMQFETTLNRAEPASATISPALQKAAADVARAFSVPVEPRPRKVASKRSEREKKPPRLSVAALPEPKAAANNDSANVSLLPPPLEHPMPDLDVAAPPAGRIVDDPYNVAPLPEGNAADGHAAAPATPGPVLPPASAPPAPKLTAITAGEMQSVMQLADEHSRRGFALGGRGALFSARSEFLNALRLVAQALDAAQQTTTHTKSLNAGLLALDESDDFIPGDGKVNGGDNVAGLIATHETVLLKGVEQEVPALIALQRYYAYAQQQLGASVQGQASGSLALHGLAKLHSVIGSRQPGSVNAPEPKSIVLEQAALSADPRNFMAANDLAVLLVRYGRMAEARTLLQNSVSSFGQPENWNNLADLHEQMGERELAQLARKAAKDAQQKLSQQRGAGGLSYAGSAQVEWVKPDAFRGVQDAGVQQPTATAVKPNNQSKGPQPFRRPAANEMWGTRKR